MIGDTENVAVVFKKGRYIMTEYCVEIVTDDEHSERVGRFYDYESAIDYINQNPLSSDTEEYRIYSVYIPTRFCGRY